MLKSKVHRATVTYGNVDYEGSCTLDPVLMAAANLAENERVDIYNVTNGQRLSTYVIRGEADSGTVGINGAAARLMFAGDIVIIASYAMLAEDEVERHLPRVVHVDADNRIRYVTPPMPASNHLASAPAGRGSDLA